MSSQSRTFVSPGPPCAALALRVLRPPIPSPGKRFALIAHPWGRLGGCMDEPVTQCLARYLASGGWNVFIYDARGVGASKGSASWTGTLEAADYQAIVDEVVAPEMAASGDEAELLLAGYSYGTLAASLSRPPRAQFKGRLRTYHLLVSYPLSVVPALTCFKSTPFRSGLSDLARDAACSDAVLLLQGTRDQFTGAGKYVTWAGELVDGQEDGSGGRGRVKADTVEGADHFWNGRRSDLCDMVDVWLSGIAAAR